MIDLQSEISIYRTDWTNYPKSAKALRFEVFVDEQNVPRELELDDTDKQAIHIIAHDQDGNVVGCARLYRVEPGVASIGRMAVRKEWRGRGIGRRLLIEGLRAGIEALDANTFTLSAQVHAIPFYQHLGFLITSEEYEEAGIPHRKMYLYAPTSILRALDEGNLERHGKNPLNPSTDEAVWKTDSFPLFNALATCAISNRPGVIRLYEPELTAEVLSDELFISRLSELARSHKNFRMNILFREDRSSASLHHPLVELGKRLTSRFTFRVTAAADTETNEALCVIDPYSVLVRPDYRKPDGIAALHHPGKFVTYRDQFDRLWHQGVRSQEINTFGL